jgi:hypothetical protein
MTNHRRNNWFEISGLQRFWPGVFQSRESAGCPKKDTDPKVTPAREFFPVTRADRCSNGRIT